MIAKLFSEMKDVKELEVYQKSLIFCEKIYVLTKSFPKEELFGITSQIRRASTSMGANIAEGFDRNSLKEFTRFLYISKGSASETEFLLSLSKSLGYLRTLEYKEVNSSLISIKKMLSKLIKSLRSKL